ncbi:MAG: hypothetical protein JO168_06085 [Solirubrobacterales bacterium]|nr:hypothetical protein [Solirubrobacterales bacterium]MBV9714174.1 hypothetical protein [Solirubrobacterales bacterium]
MELQELDIVAEPVLVEDPELAARRSLRAQIARLEGQLAEALVTSFAQSIEGLEPTSCAPRAHARMLDLGELECVRDELAERVHASRARIAEAAEAQAASRIRLEQMRLEPGRHRFTRVSCRELGERGCGVWEVRPRLGLIGMLMGWWQLKLSSGCPLARGRELRSRPP